MARRRKTNIPTYDELIKPTIEALLNLGGSGSIEEINEEVYKITKLTEEQLSLSHGDDNRTEVEYRLAWTRTILKKSGLLENSVRSVWSLTNASIKLSEIDPNKIVKEYRDAYKRPKSIVVPKLSDYQPTLSEILLALDDADETWKQQLLSILGEVSPKAFERLAQRILRESGFIQVEVTGKSGDGGIDGKGIVRINGFLSFHVIFQCKRWKGSITPDKIRDFRGAMQGRADKGLYITTGTFTRDAIKEATRDGAPPIDLIDGELLCDKLKELKLGVETKLTETIEIKADWFKNL